MQQAAGFNPTTPKTKPSVFCIMGHIQKPIKTRHVSPFVLLFRPLTVVLLCSLGVVSAVAQPLPGGAQMPRWGGVQGNPVALPPLPPLTNDTPSPTLSPSPAAMQEFQLNSLELRGVTLLSPSALMPLFEGLTGTSTTIASLTAVTRAINQVYRQHGYPLAEAMLPEQAIATTGEQAGHVVIQVAEGRKSGIETHIPDSLKSSTLVGAVLKRLNGQDFTQANIEHALLRLNQIPGVTATGKFRAGEEPGSSVLVITLTDSAYEGTAAFSNMGTRYLGPNQVEGTLNINNVVLDIFGWHDQLRLTALQTTAIDELSHGEIGYAFPLTSFGTTLEMGAYRGISRPDWGLARLDINSRTQGQSITLKQNLKTSRQTQWDTAVQIDRYTANSTSLGSTLTEDSARIMRWKNSLLHADSAQGLNYLGLDVAYGLPGGTDANTAFASRVRGTAAGFTKVGASFSHLQRLNENWSFLLATEGQFSSHALLANEEFGFGGEHFGRGYENNEIIGDHGLAAKAELQLTFRPDFWWLDSYQLFGFTDFGAVWNKDRDPMEPSEATTRTSNGFGVRLAFNPAWSGEAILAKPTSHNAFTEGDKHTAILMRLKHRFNAEAKTAAADAPPTMLPR